MILVIGHASRSYRLQSYADLVEKLREVQGVKVVPTSDETIQQIIEKAGKPDAIFLYSPDIAVSDFSDVKCPVYTWTSDYPSLTTRQDKEASKHKVKYEAVFHNFLYRRETMSDYFNADRFVHWPAWTEERYQPMEKLFDFFVSGTVNLEYDFRLRLGDAASEIKGTENHLEKTLPQSGYRELLGKSKFSPHDGGVNGRMVARYMESGLAKSVIISPDLYEEMNLNGFVEDEHFIRVDREWPHAKLVSFLSAVAQGDYSSMADRAHDLVKRRHTTAVRIRQLIGEMRI